MSNYPRNRKSRVLSQETKDKIRMSNLGQKRSEEAKQKMSAARIGKEPWNKGRTDLPPTWNKGIPFSEESKLRMSIAHTLNPQMYWLGKKRPEIKEWLKNTKAKGEYHWNWKGGINSINDTIRKSVRYKEWRSAVFERDDYTCQNCKEKGGKLNADHIMPFSLFEAARFHVGNGRTLCEPCHEEIGWKYRPKKLKPLVLLASAQQV